MNKVKRNLDPNKDIYINDYLVDCITCIKGKKCSEQKQRKNYYGNTCSHFSMIPVRCLKAILRGCK